MWIVLKSVKGLDNNLLVYNDELFRVNFIYNRMWTPKQPDTNFTMNIRKINDDPGK